MSEIRVSPEQLRQVASQFKSAGLQSGEMAAQLTGTVHGMEGEWAGVSKDQFFQEYQQWERVMREYINLLDRIGQQLEQVAQRFEEADRAVAFGGVGPVPQ